MDENMIIYDENEAIEFIAERCSVDREIIAQILELEAEYMESIGIAEIQSDSHDDLLSKLQRIKTNGRYKTSIKLLFQE